MFSFSFLIENAMVDAVLSVLDGKAYNLKVELVTTVPKKGKKVQRTSVDEMDKICAALMKNTPVNFSSEELRKKLNRLYPNIDTPMVSLVKSLETRGLIKKTKDAGRYVRTKKKESS